jgi:hypothetical protein
MDPIPGMCTVLSLLAYQTEQQFAVAVNIYRNRNLQTNCYAVPSSALEVHADLCASNRKASGQEI